MRGLEYLCPYQKSVRSHFFWNSMYPVLFKISFLCLGTLCILHCLRFQFFFCTLCVLYYLRFHFFGYIMYPDPVLSKISFFGLFWNIMYPVLYNISFFFFFWYIMYPDPVLYKISIFFFLEHYVSCIMFP